jgi:hypothetical protein
MPVEIIKSDRAAIETFLADLGYRTYPAGLNLLAIHTDDPTLGQIRVNGTQLSLAR